MDKLGPRVKTKGRGHRGGAGLSGGGSGAMDTDGARSATAGRTRGGAKPAKSVEGWIIFVSGLHQEAGEDDVLDKFSDFGSVKNVRVELEKRTGFARGYALVEFAEQGEAQAAIEGMDGQPLLGQNIAVDWAFTKPQGGGGSGGRGRKGGRR